MADTHSMGPRAVQEIGDLPVRIRKLQAMPLGQVLREGVVPVYGVERGASFLVQREGRRDDDAARAAAAGDAAIGAGIPVVQAQAGPSDPSQGHVRWAERAGDGWGVVKGASHVTPRVEYGSPVYSISIFCSTKQ
ncbi:hypothetical protein FPV67DRAFT_1447488 [Lyophyllum atratum]|nr:hypothetical protein FPV67DRAFT_1447488 [Lyophyllum atratum]